jgi:fructose-bisphosphate aldolase class 1
MTDTTNSSDREADCRARLRRRRLIGLLSACALAVAGVIALAGGHEQNARSSTATRSNNSPTPTDVTWDTAATPTRGLAQTPDQAQDGEAPVIVRPTIVPLPSAGLGGIALLVVMALWRRANLRLTTRLH